MNAAMISYWREYFANTVNIKQHLMDNPDLINKIMKDILDDSKLKEDKNDKCN